MNAVVEIRDALRMVVSSLDAEVLTPGEAQRLVGEFSQIKRLGAAGEALVARRVAESGQWRASGARSEADWLARTTGESVGSARSTLETATRLRHAPGTDEAFRAGKLSAPQAAAIAGAAEADPGSEALLLQAAERLPLGKLKDAAAQARARGEDAEARHGRIHRGRYFRTYTNAEGARCGAYALTPEAAAVVEAAVSPYIEAAYRAARATGEHEPSEAYAADGLVAMATAVRGGDVRPPCGSRWPKGETVLLVNLESLRRGSVAQGEVCEIAGVGPVPVSVATELLGETTLKIVVKDGVDIRTVVHTGRAPTAAMLTGLLARDGGRCINPTCARPVAQIDHTADWAHTHETRLACLAGLCHHCHNLKTREGHWYRRGARGWEWHHPDGEVDHERPPPDG